MGREIAKEMMNAERGMMNERRVAFQFIIPRSAFIIFSS
jgi:hypothetical protein